MPKVSKFEDMFDCYVASQAEKIPKFESKKFTWENSPLSAYVFPYHRRPMVNLGKPAMNGRERSTCMNRLELNGLERVLPLLKEEMEKCAKHIQNNCKEGVRSDEPEKQSEEEVVVVPTGSPSVSADESSPPKKYKKSTRSTHKRKSGPPRKEEDIAEVSDVNIEEGEEEVVVETK